jgi:hypothetical protein
VAVVNKRYCVEDAVINYGYVELQQQDVVRHTSSNYIFNAGGFKALVDKIHNYRRLGKDTQCLHEQLAYLQAVVDLFEIAKEEAACTTDDDYDDFKEDYKIDCIRDNLTCRYGLGNIVEELLDLLGIISPNIGISYMTIQAPDEEADCSPFQPTSPN